MTRRLIASVTALALVGAVTAADDPKPPDPKAPGWMALFNGRDLTGWKQNNGTAKYTAEGDCIVGTTTEGSPNSFLCTEKEYGDFELRFEVKVDDRLNSGVQIRSHSKPDYNRGRVHGPQVEIAADGNSGRIYDEGRRGRWLDPNTDVAKTKTAFKKGAWNQYLVRCQGDRIQTWLNDVPLADVRDDMDKSGFIGLQVHGIPKGQGPYQVRWRNLYVRALGGAKE